MLVKWASVVKIQQCSEGCLDRGSLALATRLLVPWAKLLCVQSGAVTVQSPDEPGSLCFPCTLLLHRYSTTHGSQQHEQLTVQ